MVAALLFSVLMSAGVTLNWQDNSTNEAAFEIERSEDGGRTFRLIATVPRNSTTYRDETGSTAYLYRIRAVNQSGATRYAMQEGAPPAPRVPQPAPPQRRNIGGSS